MTTVRAARLQDASDIRAIYAPAVLDSVISFEEELPSIDQLTARMTARPRMPWLVADVAGTVVGYAYASPHRQRASYRWAADCSVYIASDYQRQGIGRLLYESLFSQLRELGYVTVYAGIALPNEPSVALHERIGFGLVGVYRNVGFKHGRWLDVGWWALPLTSPLPPDPADPREWQGSRTGRQGSGTAAESG